MADSTQAFCVAAGTDEGGGWLTKMKDAIQDNKKKGSFIN